MPFNWKTPLGYLIAISLEFAGAYVSTTFATILYPLFIGSCFLVKTCVEDITSDLHPLNVDDKIAWRKKHAEAMKVILCNAVQHHSDMKQLSKSCLLLYLKKENTFSYNAHVTSPSYSHYFLSLC